jgi:hypothetical protein
MPYFTKKGTGKDKGKTCVYKKEGRTKVGCTDGPIEKYMAALHINESEENDLDWIELTNPTLQQYFDNQTLGVGDKLWLRGNADNEEGDGEIYVDGVFTITGGVNKKYLNGVDFDTTDDIKKLLGIDADQPHFLASDGNLEVYRIEKVDQLNESEDLDWLSGPTQIKFGDIKDNFKDYISVGDTIYISGTLQMVDNGEDLNYDNSIHLDMEPVIVKVPFYTNGDRLEVKFGENITDKPLWSGNISDDWLDLGGFRSDYDLLITVPEKKGVNESEENDFDWIKDIGGEIEDFVLELRNLIKEHVPVADLELDWDTTTNDGEYFGKVWLYDRFYELYKYDKFFKIIFYYLDPETDRYEAYSQYENLPKNRLLILLLNDMIKVSRKNLNESEEDDWGWVKEIEADQLIPGEIYDIKTGNGYYWIPELFVGKKWDDEHNIEMYKFKDLDGSGSGAKSTPYIKELIQKGHIRPYDPNWSIKDELTFSDNLEDALKGNFVIYFKDGVYLDQTLAIQDRLFEMGFSFYTKGPNEYITNKDSSDKIQFFECFNWDTSNPRYSSMPPNQWDLKKILLVKVSDEDTRWRRTRNPRLEEQELFLTVSSHDAIIIDGDRYITDNITESEEFDWIHQQEPEKELKKTKSYVVDVSHLRPTPMRHSHDTSLTRQDILRRFRDLGYDVEGVDVDDARYFYIEPNKGIGWDYNEYGVPIEYDYWIDYNTHYMEDPSYGGKYQMIDIDELMFLLDNNLISESKKPINEVAGISFESRKWADIIYNEITSNPEEKTRLIIDGYDYPEAFNQFPIDYIVIDYYDRITGYGQEHSGYDQDGNYVVLLYVQPMLVQGQGGYSLKSALNHEMKHAWEDYNRISRGKPNIEQTKESKELYTRDFILLMSDNNVVGPIKDVLKYFYYLSKLETSPYMENVYDKNPAYENMVRQISTKDFESFKERFDLDINWHLINTAYDIPFVKKFKSPRDFIDYSAKELRKRATKVLKKINKMKYIHGEI